MDEWFVYLVQCEGGSLYCGIAKDPAKRFKQHASGKGARYTRIYHALALVYQEGPYTHGDALRRERVIKALSRPKKFQLVEQLATTPSSKS